MLLKQDSYRYVNIALFVLASFTNAIPTQAFATVSPIITTVYNMSEFEVSINSMFYPINYIFLLLPTNYIIDQKGLKLGTLICEMFMILGCLIRMLVRVHFIFFYVGTALCSFGFCFMLSAANKFANVWFPKHQIFMANSICLFALFASDAVGAFSSSLFIREDSTKTQIQFVFMIQGIIMIIIQSLMAIFFRGKPKTMQNYASAAERAPFKNDLKQIIKNKNYIFLFVSTTFVFSALSIIFVIMPWFTKTYGYDSLTNGIIIVCANVGGLLGSVISGGIAKTKYKSKCQLCLLGMATALGLMWLALELKSEIFTYVCGFFAGVFAYPFLTTITDFATQVTFPIGQATTAGMLLFGGQFFGVLFVVAMSFLIDGSSLVRTRFGIAFILVLTCLGLFFLRFAKEDLQREKYEESKLNEERQSLIQSNDAKNDSI